MWDMETSRRNVKLHEVEKTFWYQNRQYRLKPTDPYVMAYLRTHNNMPKFLWAAMDIDNRRVYFDPNLEVEVVG